jgi:hypothetical protein
MVFYNVLDSNGLAHKNKGIYRYVQNVHTGTMKRKEIAISQKGDLTVDVSSQPST